MNATANRGRVYWRIASRCLAGCSVFCPIPILRGALAALYFAFQKRTPREIGLAVVWGATIDLLGFLFFTPQYPPVVSPGPITELLLQLHVSFPGLIITTEFVGPHEIDAMIFIGEFSITHVSLGLIWMFGTTSCLFYQRLIVAVTLIAIMVPLYACISWYVASYVESVLMYNLLGDQLAAWFIAGYSLGLLLLWNVIGLLAEYSRSE